MNKLIIILLCVMLYACNNPEKEKPKVYELAKLSAHVYNPNDSEILPHHLKYENSIKKSLGFSAATYGNKYYKVIVYRGTDNVFDGVADIGLTLSSIFSDDTDSEALNVATKISSSVLKNKVRQAQNYYNSAKQNETRQIIVTGHSLGGFLAQIVGYATGAETHTFNAPGAAEYIKKQNIKQADNINITNHLSADDIVSRFGQHVGRDTIYNHSNHSIESFGKFLEQNNK